MKLVTFNFILLFLLIHDYVNAGWEDAAKAACQKVERDFSDTNLLMKNQCRVMCVTSGQLPSIEVVEDGTACEIIIGFTRKPGTCQKGRCEKE
ncbi:hypothetical protein BJ944DRAFT_273063, partial [Cunninghamella echinulata]